MEVTFYKYQGAGNDFILVDNRLQKIKLTKKYINQVCNRNFGIGADGLMLLNNTSKADFAMEYYNSDGNKSTMCGNGGRCIVKFASDLKIINTTTQFIAIDGLHKATIHKNNIINLQMIDVSEIEKHNHAFILNTGSPHYIKFENNINNLDVLTNGKKIRNSAKFKQKGINVNFVEELAKNNIAIRTYERGVENETLACGTGVTAAALAYATKNDLAIGNHKIKVKAQGGNLLVTFFKENQTVYHSINLIGQANFVFKTTLTI